MPFELSIEELNNVSGGDIGGLSITRGGGNTNVAQGQFSEADPAIGRGRVLTNGGHNSNIAQGFEP